MSGYSLILFSVALIIVFGVVFPFVAGYFVSVDDVSTPSILNSTANIIDDGLTIDIIPIDGWGEFDINPFSWLGLTLKNYISDSIRYLGLLPNLILYPLVLIISLCLILGIISIVRGN